MNNKWISGLVFVHFFLFQYSGFSQLTAKSILKECIDYHDPKGSLLKSGYEYDILIKRNNTKDRNFKIRTNLKRNFFAYLVDNDTLKYQQGFNGGLFFNGLNDQNNVSEIEEKKYDLGKERTQYLRSVYEYLLYIPSKLIHDIQYLQPQFTTEDFNGKTCYRLEFIYDPNGKSERWCYFIDKTTFCLVGYKFFKINEFTDGEYIYLQNYQKVKDYVIPFQKDWYWNHDNSFFRSDKILSLRKI